MSQTHTQRASTESQPVNPGRVPAPEPRNKLFDRLLRNKESECYDKDGCICHVSLVTENERQALLRGDSALKKAHYSLCYFNEAGWQTILYSDVNGQLLAYDTQELIRDGNNTRATGRMIHVSNPDKIEALYTEKIRPMLDPRFLVQPIKEDVEILRKLAPRGSTRSISCDIAAADISLKGSITHEETGLLILNLTERDISGGSRPLTMRIMVDINGKICGGLQDLSNPVGPNAKRMSNGEASSVISLIAYDIGRQ